MVSSKAKSRLIGMKSVKIEGARMKEYLAAATNMFGEMTPMSRISDTTSSVSTKPPMPITITANRSKIIRVRKRAMIVMELLG